MPTFDETCILIPTSTLEDFPSQASDSDACSMLAAWTVLWHPRLLAQSGQTPSWYRADSPPEPTAPRVVTVPTMSRELVPERYEARCREFADGRWVTGTTRAEMLQALELGDDPPRLPGKHRTIGVEDFFAAGFTALQIQVMTRRLRYTSNLDEIHLQNRVVAAAKAFLDGDAETAINALHDFFDALAEERDHYFASDPHLIDLTLLTPSTLPSLLTSAEWEPPTQVANESSNACLPTPRNLLIDAETAQAIAADPDRFQAVSDALRSGQLGWAGGGPDAKVAFDTMTYRQAEHVLFQAHQQATESIGTAPAVYARYAGATPSDLTRALVQIGYAGIIPIDFAAGTGFGDEAKVIRQAGGAEIESLTAKPIDAASDAAFLDLGPRLGEAIDSGEIATALLAHWPGRVCTSFLDLRCAASWTLALGRFWKLDAYFREGERPYHHGLARAATADSADYFRELVAAGEPDPISTVADRFRQSIIDESRRRLGAMTHLVRGSLQDNLPSLAPEDPQVALLAAAANFAAASGAQVDAPPLPSEETKSKPPSAARNGTPVAAVMLVNPHDAAVRQTVALAGSPPTVGDQIFAATRRGAVADVTVDIPALGFATAQRHGGAGSRGSLLGRWFGKASRIAEEDALQNEFMEVSISPSTGGLQGVYSGGTRGNRFSLRLVVEPSGLTDKAASHESGHAMVCRELRVVQSTGDVGELLAVGSLNDATGKRIANFELTYTLRRGSRWVEVTSRLSDVIELGEDPWREYLALRAAVSTEAAIYRVLLRDKVHRAAGRRLVSPLGVVIDEADRQTLVASAGLAYHRRVGDRFLDTLLWVRGESQRTQKVSYGFDVPLPVPSAKGVMVPPCVVPISPSGSLSPRGWILHSAPKDVTVADVELGMRADGRLAAVVRLIQTRSKPTTATVRFCRDVAFAMIADLPGMGIHGDEGSESVGRFDVDVPNSASSVDEETPRDPRHLQVERESVRVPISGHQVMDVLVVFQQ